MICRLYCGTPLSEPICFVIETCDNKLAKVKISLKFGLFLEENAIKFAVG